jgi:hypothetical protein
MEKPDGDPYADPDVKDIVGLMPEYYCTRCSPIARLRPGEAIKCLGREEPCWKPSDEVCP